MATRVHDELERRRLTDETDGKLPMTVPPQISPIPSWPVATLTADKGAEGLATITCPSSRKGGTTCDLGKIIIAPDDGTQIKIGSGRQVVAWCRATNSLQRGAAPITVVRLSFTNADTVDAANPPAYGWFDARPTQVLTGKTPIDPATLASC